MADMISYSETLPDSLQVMFIAYFPIVSDLDHVITAVMWSPGFTYRDNPINVRALSLWVWHLP